MTAEERLLDAGYEDVVIFKNYSYDSALIGVTDDNRAVYSFEKMVDWLVENEGFEEIEAMEFIEYNSLRALPYAGSQAPIVMFELPEFE